MAAYPGWDVTLLHQLGVPVSTANLQWLHQWQAHEGGGASFNPLNTTQPWHGAGSYNSVGVRNYPTADVGLAATVKTLRNGHYGPILAALASGNPRWSQPLADALSTWGTGSAWMAGYHSAPTGQAPAPADAPVPAPLASAPPPVTLPAGLLAQLNHTLTAHIGGAFPALGAPTRLNIVPRVDKGGTLTAPKTRAQPVTGAGAAIVTAASHQLGQPYVWGGESRGEGGFDCSGLVDWALRQHGYHGPRLTTWNIASLGVSVKGQALRPGDLVLANGGRHVVIYAGGGKVIAAPHRGTVVQYQPLGNFNVVDVRRV